VGIENIIRSSLSHDDLNMGSNIRMTGGK